MSRYSAQILICFIAYIFVLFFIPLCVWLGTLQDCQYAQCPLPLSIVIRMRLVIRQSSQHALLRCSWPIKTLSGIYASDWWNWQIKWMKSVSMGSFQYKNQVNGESFAFLWVSLLYFSLESRLIPAVLELGQVRWYWKLIRLRIWQLSHSCQTGVWEYFPSSLALK